MGASNHQRVEALDEDTMYVTRIPMYVTRIDGAPARAAKRLTVAEVWNRIYDEEGWESGHSYSGTFGSKPEGYVVVATLPHDKATLKLAGQAVMAAAFGEQPTETYGLTPEQLARAAEIFNDKWGPAVALVGKDHVWFGGMCSS